MSAIFVYTVAIYRQALAALGYPAVRSSRWDTRMIDERMFCVKR
jgi:hypothetical protein